MNFSGILIGVLTFFLIGLFHPIVIYAEYYFGSRCWPVFLLVGILCMILSVRMQEILWSVSLGAVSYTHLTLPTIRLVNTGGANVADYCLQNHVAALWAGKVLAMERLRNER